MRKVVPWIGAGLCVLGAYVSVDSAGISNSTYIFWVCGGLFGLLTN